MLRLIRLHPVIHSDVADCPDLHYNIRYYGVEAIAGHMLAHEIHKTKELYTVDVYKGGCVTLPDICTRLFGGVLNMRERLALDARCHIIITHESCTWQEYLMYRNILLHELDWICSVSVLRKLIQDGSFLKKDVLRRISKLMGTPEAIYSRICWNFINFFGLIQKSIKNEFILSARIMLKLIKPYPVIYSMVCKSSDLWYHNSEYLLVHEFYTNSYERSDILPPDICTKIGVDDLNEREWLALKSWNFKVILIGSCT